MDLQASREALEEDLEEDLEAFVDSEGRSLDLHHLPIFQKG